MPSNWAQFNGQPIAESYHALTHQQADPVNWEEKCRILDVSHAGEFANLIGRLKDIKEGNSTILNNSLALWTSEIGEGSTHTGQNIPTVIAGTAGGAIQSGRYLTLPNNTMNYGLLISFLQAMGHKDTSIGRSGANVKPIL